jgi:polysaccharide export outer membrane protein
MKVTKSHRLISDEVHWENERRKLNQPASTLRVLWSIGCCLCVLIPNFYAQQKRGGVQPDPPISSPGFPPQTTTRIFDNSDKDYQISPGDILRIQIEDAPELTRDYQVYASGEIEMPVLGVFKVRKLTTLALSRMISKSLKDAEYLNSPNVVVTISKYNNHTYFIQGAVKNPGAYQIDGQPSLLTLVSLAGGLNENHGTMIFILRPRKIWNRTVGDQVTPSLEPPKSPSVNPDVVKDQQAVSQAGDANSLLSADYEMTKVRLSALYSKGDFEQNQNLQPGDIINIPRADTFFVAGEVHAPGSFPLKDGTTLRQAITLAQGMTFKAKSSQGVIFREDPVRGKRVEIKVDLSAVMNGKKDDLPILANDVILIPNSRAKTIGSTLLTAFGVNSARLPNQY